MNCASLARLVHIFYDSSVYWYKALYNALHTMGIHQKKRRSGGPCLSILSSQRPGPQCRGQVVISAKYCSVPLPPVVFSTVLCPVKVPSFKGMKILGAITAQFP